MTYNKIRHSVIPLRQPAERNLTAKARGFIHKTTRLSFRPLSRNPVPNPPPLACPHCYVKRCRRARGMLLLPQQFFQFILKSGQFVFNDIPYQLQINRKVFVYDHVAHARCLAPFYLRVLLTILIWQILYRFADHLQATDCRILHRHVVIEIILSRISDILLDIFNTLDDMFQKIYADPFS